MNNSLNKTVRSGIGTIALAVLGTMQFALPAPAGQSLGNVDFQSTCQKEANDALNTGLGLLHHMMYFQADAAFTKAGEDYPECAMLHWGTAMTKFHPLWPGRPAPSAFAEGQAALERMNEAAAGSDLEQAFMKAVSAYYEGADTVYPDRIRAWATAQGEVFAGFPEDVEATALNALALLALAPKGDRTMSNQREAGALMEALNERTEFHPGVYHYAIHAYDNPLLYKRGLPFAEAYGQIAPQVAHALHMPSHIFVRAGQWDDVISWNARSAKAALAHPAGDFVSGHYAHAMDYMIYGHLQKGDFDAAEAHLADFLGHPNHQPNFGAAYALAAAPVRVALEQEQWQRLAGMSGDMHSAIPWDKFPQAVSMRLFAIGLGAARSGDTKRAEAALSELANIRQRLSKMPSPYWLTLTDAQILTVEAWLELARGNGGLAVSLQTKAADLEDKAGKSPVTPGHVLPARELLGDLLMKTGQADDARVAYAASLALAPNRRRSMGK